MTAPLRCTPGQEKEGGGTDDFLRVPLLRSGNQRQGSFYKDFRPLNDNLRPDDAVLEQGVARKRMPAFRTSLLRYAKAKAGEGMPLLLYACSPSLYGSLCLSFQTLKSSNPISVLWMLFSVLIQLPILPAIWHPMYGGLPVSSSDGGLRPSPRHA